MNNISTMIVAVPVICSGSTLNVTTKASPMTHGVRVFTVGFGTKEGAMIGAEGWSAYVRLGEETLQQSPTSPVAPIFTGVPGRPEEGVPGSPCAPRPGAQGRRDHLPICRGGGRSVA